MENKMKETENELVQSRKHMQRVQELNSKLLEKIKYDTDSYSGMDEENKHLR